MIDLLFIQLCSVAGVHPHTIREIIRVESSLNELAVNVNRSQVKFDPPKTKEEALALAQTMIGKGFSLDLGLMQVNSSHLKEAGPTVKDLFDPCRNIYFGSKILKESYISAERKLGPGQAALRAALSAYNTGHMERGFTNGYVQKYYKNKLSLAENPYTASMIPLNFGRGTP